MEEEKESLFRKLYEPHISPIAGIMDFINELHQNGVKLGIATSAPVANLNLILTKVALRDKVGSILASEDVKKHKPDPEVYLKSAANLGVKPENCIVFEDSYSGVSAALNAGMQVAGVLTSHTVTELPPCGLYLKDYTELSYGKILNFQQARFRSAQKNR